MHLLSKVVEARKEPVAKVPVDDYPCGPFDTSLLNLYGDHDARHVWEGKVYLLTFVLHLFQSNIIVIGDFF